MKSTLKPLAPFAALILLAYFGLVRCVPAAWNIFAFLTIIGAPIYAILLLTSFSVKHGEQIRKAYRDAGHLPKWADRLAYWCLILLCAAPGHFVIAFLWMVIYWCDFGARRES